MALASTSVLMVKQSPPYGCCQCLCPQVVPQLMPTSPGGCPRLASGSDPGSFQVTASVLGEHVRFGMHPLRAESLFPIASSSSVHKPCWPSKPGILGAHFPGAESLGWGS